jgi:hypothetical protein
MFRDLDSDDDAVRELNGRASSSGRPPSLDNDSGGNFRHGELENFHFHDGDAGRPKKRQYRPNRDNKYT